METTFEMICPRDQDDPSSTQEVVQSCLAIVEQKCKGEITTAEAILDLLKTLPEGGDIHIFSWYVKQLIEAESERATNLKQGNASIPQTSRNDDMGQETADEPSPTAGTK